MPETCYKCNKCNAHYLTLRNAEMCESGHLEPIKITKFYYSKPSYKPTEIEVVLENDEYAVYTLRC